MKVLILNWRDINNPLAGGAEISLFEHAKYWEQHGATVVWFSSSFKGAKNKETVRGIKIIRAGTMYSVHLLAFIYYILGKLGKFDIVIDSFHGIPFFTPLYIKKDKIVALINEVARELWFDNFGFPKAQIGYYIEPFTFKLYKGVHFISGSNSTKSELAIYGIKKNMIHIIHHGVNTLHIDKKIKKEKIPTILFLNRIAKDKGINDALVVFKKLENKRDNIHLWIAGKEEQKGMLNNLLEQHNLLGNKKIKYFGFVSEVKKFELYKRAWILIHPSRKEGWGLTVIESASQGTPTVGYKVGGLIDSVMHKKTGLLTTPSSNNLLIAVEKLLNNKLLYNSLSKESLKWSGYFDWKESGKKSFEFLQSI